MKGVILAAALMLVTFAVSFAQTEKGRLLAGAQVGNLTFPTGGGGGSIVSVQPTVGWFLVDNLALGIGIPLFTAGNSNFRTTQIGATPFLRYYVGKKNVRPFLNLSGGVINSTVSSNFTGGGRESSTEGIYSVGAGLAFLLNRYVSFDLGLSYTGGQTTTVGSIFGGANGLTPVVPESFSLNFGFQIFLGK